MSTLSLDAKPKHLTQYRMPCEQGEAESEREGEQDERQQDELGSTPEPKDVPVACLL